MATFASSHGSRVSSKVFSTIFPYFFRESPVCWRLTRPERRPSTMATAPLEPKVFVAICRASVLSFALMIADAVSSSMVLALLPSLAALTTSFFREARTPEVSTPFASNSASICADASSPKPSSRKLEPLLSSVPMRVSMVMPVSCPTLVNRPRTFLVSEASTPKAFMILSVLSTELETSVPLIWANSRKSLDMASSASPVLWNLVLTSPTAAPTSAISTGMELNTLSATPCISFRACPDAPVLVMIVSYPSSSSFAASYVAFVSF